MNKDVDVIMDDRKGIERTVLNGQYIEDSINNVKLVKWAFNLGYELGRDDCSEGVHVNFVERQKYIIAKLIEEMKEKVLR